MPPKKRGNRTLFLLLGSILVFILIVGAIVYGLVILPKKNSPSTTPTPTPTPKPATSMELGSATWTLAGLALAEGVELNKSL